MESKKFLQSYVYGNKGNFFVSTCHRQSSGPYPDMWFYETFAWRLDEKNDRTDWVADNSGARGEKGAYSQHIEVVSQLHQFGSFKESYEQ